MHGILSLRINAIDDGWVPSTFCKNYFIPKVTERLYRLVEIPFLFLGLCVAKREAANAWESFVLLLLLLEAWERSCVLSMFPGHARGNRCCLEYPCFCLPCTQHRLHQDPCFLSIQLAWMVVSPWKQILEKGKPCSKIPFTHMAPMEALIFHGRQGCWGMSLLWLQETAGPVGQGPEKADSLRWLFPLKNSGVGNPSPWHKPKRLTS